jgi:hypothetical protein
MLDNPSTITIVVFEILIVSNGILRIPNDIHLTIRFEVALFTKYTIAPGDHEDHEDNEDHEDHEDHEDRSNGASFHGNPFIKENERVLKDKEVYQQ